MKMPSQALRRKITFWQSHGLLKEESCDKFTLVEEHRGRTQDAMMIEEDETESAMASAQDQKEEELQVSNHTPIYFNLIIELSRKYKILGI